MAEQVVDIRQRIEKMRTQIIEKNENRLRGLGRNG